MNKKDKLEGEITLERKITRLEDETIYKKLTLRRDIIKLIFDLRMYRVVLKGQEKTEEFDTNHLLQFMNDRDCITPRIEAILAGAREGLVNVSALDTASDDLYGELFELEKRYPERKDDIADIDNEIVYTKHCCPNCKPLCVELMEFTTNSYISDKLKSKIFDLTRNLLAYTKYDREAEERKYLTAKSPSTALYRAYFFRPMEVSGEEQSFALAELLRVVALSEFEYPTKFDLLIAEHLAQKDCSIDSDTYEFLLDEKFGLTKDRTRKALSTIYKSQHELPIDLNDYIKTRMISILEEEGSYTKGLQLRDLCTVLLYAAPIREWVETFATELARFPKGDSYADGILEYLRDTFKNPIPPLFEDAYYVAKMELQEKRTDLVLVLKAIGEKKNKKSE